MFRLLDRYCHMSASAYGFAVHRVFTLMRKLGAQTVAVETDFDPDLRARLDIEHAALTTRLQNPQLKCVPYRLTFMTESLTEESQLSGVPDSAFLGYAVLNNLPTGDPKIPVYTYVFESVVREPGRFMEKTKSWEPLLNNYLHVQRAFRCYVGGKDYTIPGTFFCQQNTVTSVCAHACTAMAITNSCHDGAIVTCEDINKQIGIDHKARMLHSRFAENSYATNLGLTTLEITAAFHRYNLDAMEFQCAWPRDRLYFRPFLYGFVESGFPAVLIFNTAKNVQHVVAVVGHTLNSDSWLPLAFSEYAPRIAKIGDEVIHRPYLTTLDWLGDFIVHDDNFGMCLCLPGHSFRPEEHVDPSFAFMPSTVIGVSPKGMLGTLKSYEAEAVAHHRLHELFDAKNALQKKLLDSLVSSYYGFHLFSQLANEKAVFRAVHVSREEYLKHLNQPDHFEVTLSPKQLQCIGEQAKAHKQFWLVEVTISDLYVGNKAKLADIAIDPSYRFDKTDKGPAGVLFMRLPGVLLIPGNDAATPWVAATPLAVQSHMPLYALNSARLLSSTW